MRFLDTIRRAKAYLAEQGRVSLSALKLEFDLDPARLESLIEELVDVQGVAAREGKVLSWIGPVPGPDDGGARKPPAQSKPPAVREAHTAERQAAEGERRQITVMFCDLVDSTELSELLDAEDLADVVTAYQQTCAASIDSFEGHVAQYLGDGLLVYFGYPMAHEDDPVRAIHAALRIIQEVPELNRRLAEEHPTLREHPLLVRLGIHTGPVVVGGLGEGDKRERLALGDTVNIAARLEGVAEPGTIVVSGATQHLVRGVFVFEELGERLLKGIEEPVALSRPVQPTGVQSRLELSGASSLTPLVGRQQQLGILLERWEDTKAGHGQVVLLSGEAGMGKSRLLEELRRHVADEPHTWYETRGSSYHQNSAFYPVIELIERAMMFNETDQATERLAKLKRGFGYSGFPTEEILPLLANLLGIPLPQDLPPLALSPEARRERTLKTLAVLPVALAQRQPLIMIVEDLHWYDLSSLEVAGMTIQQVPAARILLVATFRPEFEPPWRGSSKLMHLTLSALSHKQIEVMTRHLTGGKPLPREVRQQLAAKTDGVPLFVEELTRGVLDSGLVAESDERYERTDALPELAIPTTLRDSLTARLDRLGPARELAQIASVIGREFTHDVLRVVSPLDPATLDEALGELVKSGVVYQRGIPPLASYVFKHALIQEAAYESLLKKRRREYNALVARALEEHFPARVRSEPAVLARYYEEGGLIAEAVSSYQRAGERALASSAYEEAIRYLRQGVALLAAHSEGAEDAREVPLQFALAGSVVAARGYTHPEVEETYERARVLCEAVGDTVGLGWSLAGLAVFSHHSGQAERCATLAARVLGIAEDISDPDLALRGHLDLAAAEYFQGKFASSRSNSDAVLASFEPGRDQVSILKSASEDRDVVAFGFSAWSLWNLGWPDRALAHAREAVALARRVDHPFSLANALFFEIIVLWLRRDIRELREQAAEIMSLCEAQGFPFFLGLGRTCHAAARVAAGEPEAVSDLLPGLAQSGGTGSRAGAPGLFAILGDAYIGAGQLTEARGAIEGGMALASETGQQVFDAGLHRLLGELTLAEGGAAAEAEVHFQRALDTAHSQQARSFELRAGTNLARLWRDQGKPAEARDLLAPLYDGFTEGFDTPDLKDAKMLLDELS